MWLLSPRTTGGAFDEVGNMRGGEADKVYHFDT